MLIVLSEPVPGREDEYNDWYTDTHLAEVVATPGFVAAQRFVLADVDGNEGAPHGYVAIYEVEGDVRAAQAALAAGKDARVPVPDAMAPARQRWWFTAVSERVEAAQAATS